MANRLKSGELLKDEPAPTKHVEAEAKATGIAWRTVRHGSDALTVKKQKSNGSWCWSLPGIANLSRQLVHLVQPSDIGQGGQPNGRPVFLDPFDASQASTKDSGNSADAEEF